MPAGRHDHRAEIQTATTSDDAGGNAVYTWTTVATRWASLQDSGGGELYRAQKVDATIDSVVIFREQYEGLTPEDRIVIDGRTFNIKAVLNKSDRTAKRGQTVYCKEVVS
jgi:SPP1 family predicted phage head-tail adaptor